MKVGRRQRPILVSALVVGLLFAIQVRVFPKSSFTSQGSFNAVRVREPFQASFQAGQRDAYGQELLGTELLNVVPYHDKLYASTGVWEDPNPASGSQILVLESVMHLRLVDATLEAWNAKHPHGCP